MIFKSYQKNGLIRNIRLVSKFTNSYNTYITQYPQGKDNQTMKFGHLEEYNMANIFLQNCAENEEKGLVPHFLFFKKSLYDVKVSDLQLSFSIFQKPLTLSRRRPLSYRNILVSI